MDEQLTELHRAVVDALSEIDALHDKVRHSAGRAIALSEVGIGLDRARIALEAVLFPRECLADVQQLDALN